MSGKVSQIFMKIATDPEDMAEVLEKHSLNENSTCENGRTLLFYACEYATAELVYDIKGGCVEIKHRDKSGRTVMHVAAERGQVDIMKMLTNVDPVLVNSVDNQGCTPLHLAAQEGLTDSVRFLIDWGVDVNIRDKSGRSPLSLALVNDHAEMCELLLRAGAHCPSPRVAQDAELSELLKYYSANATWLRAYLVDSMMHYTQIFKCETVLVLKEGLVTEELFANLTTAQFNAAYLSQIGISGLGVQQLLLRLHLRLHQKHRRLGEEAATTAAAAGAGTAATTKD